MKLPVTHNAFQTIMTTFLTLFVIVISNTLVADTSVQQIKQRVSLYVESQLKRQNMTGQPNHRVSYEVSQIDPRLRLADCNLPLSIDLGSKQLLGRVTAKVQCRGDKPWTIYVPVSIKVFKKVVTARTPVTKGDVLTRETLQLTEHEVSTLTQGYFTDLNAVANKQLRRSVTLNGIIKPNMLIEPKVVKKGDEVMIVAVKGSLAVRSPGVAMGDGRVGQQIMVKNSASKRLVKATVKQKGLVEVII